MGGVGLQISGDEPGCDDAAPGVELGIAAHAAVPAHGRPSRAGAADPGSEASTRPRAQVRVSVVIPALNEAANLPFVLERLPRDLYEVILVDGGSTDGTASVARELRPDVIVLRQTRGGKGNALACGVARARGEVIVMLDGDGSNDPAEIERYVDALLDGAHFVTGSRFLPGGGSSDITWIRRLGDRWLKAVTNLVHGTHYSDPNYGYNALWRACAPALGFDEAAIAGESGGRMRRGDGFEIETLISIRAAASGLTVAEVPSFERERRHGRSHLKPVFDGLRVARTILLERWARRSSAQTSAGGDIIDLTSIVDQPATAPAAPSMP